MQDFKNLSFPAYPPESTYATLPPNLFYVSPINPYIPCRTELKHHFLGKATPNPRLDSITCDTPAILLYLFHSILHICNHLMACTYFLFLLFMFPGRRYHGYPAFHCSYRVWPTSHSRCFCVLGTVSNSRTFHSMWKGNEKTPTIFRVSDHIHKASTILPLIDFCSFPHCISSHLPGSQLFFIRDTNFCIFWVVFLLLSIIKV